MSRNFEDVQNLYTNVLGLNLAKHQMTDEELEERIKFILEEVHELQDAQHLENTVEIIDALIDIVYVVMGIAALKGINWQAHWNEVHQANLRKRPGKNPSRPNMTYDLIKPEGWKEPDHYKVLQAKPKLMIIGHARHGKDTVCEYLRDNYGFRFTSSSFLLAPYIHEKIFPTIYKDYKACWEDRHNHRQIWFEAIRDYTSIDKTLLARLIYSNNDIYCGIRDASELWAVNKANLYDFCIWVDACGRLPKEPTTSMNVTHHMADYVLNNNGTLKELYVLIDRMMENRYGSSMGY